MLGVRISTSVSSNNLMLLLLIIRICQLPLITAVDKVIKVVRIIIELDVVLIYHALVHRPLSSLCWRRYSSVPTLHAYLPIGGQIVGHLVFLLLFKLIISSSTASEYEIFVGLLQRTGSKVGVLLLLIGILREHPLSAILVSIPIVAKETLAAQVTRRDTLHRQARRLIHILRQLQIIISQILQIALEISCLVFEEATALVIAR